MKIRNGFVSNSSSSSFVIAVKNGDLKSLLESMQSEMDKSLKKYPSIFTNIVDDVFSSFLNSSEKFDAEREISDCYNGDETEFWNDNEKSKKLIDSGYTIYKVNVSSDDCEDMGQYLYQNIENLEYKSKDGNLIITNGY